MRVDCPSGEGVLGECADENHRVVTGRQCVEGEVSMNESGDCAVICNDGVFEEAEICGEFKKNYVFDGDWSEMDKLQLLRNISHLPEDVFAISPAGRDSDQVLLTRVPERYAVCDGYGDDPVTEKIGCTLAHGQSLMDEEGREYYSEVVALAQVWSSDKSFYDGNFDDYIHHEMGHAVQMSKNLGSYCGAVGWESYYSFSGGVPGLTDYGTTNCGEDFAETFAILIREEYLDFSPCDVKWISPERYGYFTEEVFGGGDV